MSNLSCKLLLVDSDVADAELAGDLLRQSFPHCELVTVTDAVAFAEQLSLGGFAAAVSELALGWASGTDVLTAIADRYPETVTVLFVKSLPPNVKDLQSASVPSAILKKDEAGFLKLADTVGSGLCGAQASECHPETERRPSTPGGKTPAEPNSDQTVKPVLSTEPGQPSPEHLYLLRRKAAEAFLRWKIADRNRAGEGHSKKSGKPPEKEARMLKEDFDITWDEKRELYELDVQLALLNARYLQTKEASPIDPDSYLAQAEKVSIRKSR
ncbi:hypothetical protein [Thiolapillus sp.]|uniref:hypothetical protein n=2 Tax=Thiolapillus sp. TaxID=2017437 RepID=UPI0025D3C131|nr:hypothetical protein [Thiolapillus sp.]